MENINNSFNFRLRHRFVIIFILMLFVGAGCRRDAAALNDESIKTALLAAAGELKWIEEIVERPPDAENSYSGSFGIYANYREKEGELDTVRNGIEVIKFENAELAEKFLKADGCFKGSGIPQNIEGITACCFGDKARKTNRTAMVKDNYVFKSYDFFHFDCYSADFLRTFWRGWRD